MQALRAELEAARSAGEDARALAAARRAAAAPTNKKNEDAAWDVETGGVLPVWGPTPGGFQPLAGLVRSAPPRIAPLLRPVALAAAQADRAQLALDRRPAARAVLLVYFVLLHIAVVLF